MTNDYKKESVGVLIANQVSDLAKSLDKEKILAEVNIYGASDKDGSATMSFEWLGQDNAEFCLEILKFFFAVKGMILSLNKETREQIDPTITELSGGLQRVLYRFRMWPEEGFYESGHKRTVNE